MEERILILLEKEKIALSVSEINDHLDLKTIDELKELLKALNNLEDTLKLYRTNKDKYMIFNNSNLQLGKMITHKKGFGFVDIEGDIDVFVAPNNINNAIHGDTVVVEITSKKGIELEGRIVRIVDRKIRPMVGEFYEENGKGKIKLDDEKVKLDITIPNPNGAVDGNKVLVKVTNKLQNNNYNGEILEVLGHKNDPGVDILSIVYKYGINTVFSEEVLNELDKIPQSVKEEEMIGRKDLREEIIFTIDGADTKDIDDAISIEKLENGNYNLGVHIADVSYYVKENTEIDKEAYDRGTSVYLADRVIPMLPHKLSNGICSLNPNVDRLAMSCSMEIDKDGNVVDYNIFESVINSKIKMTYTSVNDYLENNKVNEGYEPFTEKLSLMKDLADILRANKDKRGYIDFNIDESKIIVNEQGEAVDVKLRDRGTGEKLIEDFMIAANETVATHIYFMDLPFIYRIHGIPKEERVENFLKFIKVLGYNITTDKANITPKTMQAILLELKDKKEFHILSSLLLRSMQKAIYDKSNIGHFGLASKYY
ncbi:MAG: ribonuclease R, partial [Mycoplasmatota bacterium]